jgi:PAS domain S-box-containing protein
MGELTRNHAWSTTALGTPDQWPQSLRITLGLVLHSAFPMLLFWGDQLTCFYNDAFRPSLGTTGKHPALGKAGQDMWSEIWDFIGPLLETVKQTGQPVYFEDQLVPFYRNGHLEDIYWTFSYSPAYGDTGEINGVLVTCTETTAAVLNRQQLQEAESDLRIAVELAQLGTWSIDVATNGLTYSDRLINWFGYDPRAQDYGQVIPILSEEDQQRVATAVARALRPESDGIYEEIYTVIHPKTGQKRILHAHGKAVFDAAGKAIRLNGTAQDITLQQELQLSLEHEVQQRTEQLEAANEALAAINEELEASNEEYTALNQALEETNGLLMRSNENLQTFAYVASHDLQEPLRKIQQFGDLLKMRYRDSTGEELVYLERMQSAASRMSTLIRDLLNFSRLSTQRESNTVVDLNEVVREVLTTLELVIAQTGAQIQINLLPRIQGDASQLAQLFQNLLSNALKFRQATVSPRIQINAHTWAASELPAWVKPGRAARTYYQIDVIDNGVGFDEKYLDRIFQVFQRLHGKSEFAGTGIGLAICERVVANHGGAISARSKPGEGATFSVYFPG